MRIHRFIVSAVLSLSLVFIVTGGILKWGGPAKKAVERGVEQTVVLAQAEDRDEAKKFMDEQAVECDKRGGFVIWTWTGMWQVTGCSFPCNLTTTGGSSSNILPALPRLE